MKTQIEEQPTLTDNLLRALALRQFNGDDFFILIGIEARAFEGTEAEAKEGWEEYLLDDSKRVDGEHFSFYEWVCENLIEIEEHENDYNADYFVYTDEEADEAMIEEVRQSAWAFNAEFILEECGLDLSGAESLRNMQSESCEYANDFILSLIEKCSDIETFAEAAASADGRGHFLARYDGDENEITLPDSITGNGEKTFYIYRVN